jgi:hypothetical protein
MCIFHQYTARLHARAPGAAAKEHDVPRRLSGEIFVTAHDSAFVNNDGVEGIVRIAPPS